MIVYGKCWVCVYVIGLVIEDVCVDLGDFDEFGLLCWDYLVGMIMCCCVDVCFDIVG